jgi:hypothetical protein
MFMSIPTLIRAVHRDDPPYERNSRGMPVTGIIPVAIPMFTNRWKKNIDRSPVPHSVA